MKCTYKYPPFTQYDILLLKGKPMIKQVRQIKGTNSQLLEEWTYYSDRIKAEEYYIFKDNRLIAYKSVAV
jgi:hypothetical protein